MPDEIYTDARLAAVYEIFNPPAADTEFFVDLAGETPCRVLDMGCGTGQQARAFAQRGHRVTGADPSAAMLEIARSRPGGEQVTWVQSDAAGLDLDERFDLITMAGHVFQIFLEDEAIRAALISLRRHLAPGGRLSFDTRNPDPIRWEDWTRTHSLSPSEVPGIGRVDLRFVLRSAADGLATFDTYFAFPEGETLARPSTLRFLGPQAVLDHLTDAGFADIQMFGHWDRRPFGPAEPEILVVAR